MRTTKLLLGLACAFALSACGPEHKSVLEPLTPDEADELAGKYEHFIGIYERVIFPKVDKLPEHSLFRQRLEKLTYRDFTEFYLLDETEWKKQFSEEWKRRYDMDKLNHQVDSIVAYWKNRYPDGLPYVLNLRSEQVPLYVRYYVETGKDYWRDDIIRDMIDSTFVEEHSYVSDHVSRKKYKHNPLAYAFLHGEEIANETKEEIESENK